MILWNLADALLALDVAEMTPLDVPRQLPISGIFDLTLPLIDLNILTSRYGSLPYTFEN